MVDIMLNGRVFARVKKSQANRIVKKMVNLRRKGKIHPEVTIAYIRRREEVRIDTQGGRVLRPLIVVRAGKPLLTKEDLKKLEKECSFFGVTKTKNFWLFPENQNSM